MIVRSEAGFQVFFAVKLARSRMGERAYNAIIVGAGRPVRSPRTNWSRPCVAGRRWIKRTPPTWAAKPIGRSAACTYLGFGVDKLVGARPGLGAAQQRRDTAAHRQPITPDQRQGSARGALAAVGII